MHANIGKYLGLKALKHCRTRETTRNLISQQNGSLVNPSASGATLRKKLSGSGSACTLCCPTNTLHDTRHSLLRRRLSLRLKESFLCFLTALLLPSIAQVAILALRTILTSARLPEESTRNTLSKEVRPRTYGRQLNRHWFKLLHAFRMSSHIGLRNVLRAELPHWVWHKARALAPDANVGDTSACRHVVGERGLVAQRLGGPSTPTNRDLLRVVSEVKEGIAHDQVLWEGRV